LQAGLPFILNIMRKLIFALFLFLVYPHPSKGDNNTGPAGWASVPAYDQEGTTGGHGGTVVTVSTMEHLDYYCNQTEPFIIQIEGMIPITPKGRHIPVRSNKTIVGIGPGAGLFEGGFRVGNDQKNIIFRNLTISDTYVDGDWDGKEQDWDGIQIKGTCHHVWVDFCTFTRQGDGAVDITNGASYITVSNCKFEANNKVSLIGSSDTDTHTDKYKVTMYNNWFNKTTQRHPRVRFGMVHLFNNYYYDMGAYGREMGYATSNGYGIGVGVAAQLYSENNFFEKCVYPGQFYDNQQLPGYIIDIGSHFLESGNMQTKPDGISWDPSDYYDYTLLPAEEVKEFVMANAGAEEDVTGSSYRFGAERELHVSNYPNPFSSSTRLTFVLPGSGRVSIRLIDITGRIVREITNELFPEGTNDIHVTRGDLKAGLYFLLLDFEGHSKTIKIIVN
jgi:pectate lyase